MPLSSQWFEVNRTLATREEMEQLHKAIIGDFKDGDFGYVGDMGKLPSSLDDLVINPGTTTSTPKTNGILMGWNGPYINVGADATDYKTDEFGMPYDYGVVGVGQIRSFGPDRTKDTADDIIFPPKPVSFSGSLTLTVFTSKLDRIPNRAPAGKTIVATFFYSDNGQEASVSITNTDTSTNSFLFKSDVPPYPNTHPGSHAVKVELRASDGTVEKTVLLNAIIPIRGQVNQHVFIR